MTDAQYQNTVANLLAAQLTGAINTAQALAENAISLSEEIKASNAWALHQQLVEIERCIAQAAGISRSR